MTGTELLSGQRTTFIYSFVCPKCGMQGHGSGSVRKPPDDTERMTIDRSRSEALYAIQGVLCPCCGLLPQNVTATDVRLGIGIEGR
jgi:hypothetical protein